MNAQINLEGLRIYGLLTNLVQFRFYSYDPIALQFCFDETIIIDNKRPGAFSDMMDGVYIFSEWHRLGVDHLHQFPIKSSVLFCQAIRIVYGHA